MLTIMIIMNACFLASIGYVSIVFKNRSKRTSRGKRGFGAISDAKKQGLAEESVALAPICNGDRLDIINLSYNRCSIHRSDSEYSALAHHIKLIQLREYQLYNSMPCLQSIGFPFLDRIQKDSHRSFPSCQSTVVISSKPLTAI